ncbi:hypothetical protein [Methanooceanicella nereidis]|nr:hypothetical protein [Methanocella sp. CWC-04]
MPMNIINVKVDDEQEETILSAGKDTGYVMMIMNDEGGIRISTEELETMVEGENDAATIDFTSEYYEHVFEWLGDNDVEVTDDIVETISQQKEAEFQFEENEYAEAIKKSEKLTTSMIDQLKEKLEQGIDTAVTPKMKNDYRAALKKLNNKEYDLDYITKWSVRLIGEDEAEKFRENIDGTESDFVDRILKNRMYNRLFIDDYAFLEGDGSLKWVSLEKKK